MEPSDLQYLTDEDVEEMGTSRHADGVTAVLLICFFCTPSGGALTRVEKKRLQAAVQAARGAPLPHSCAHFVSD